MKRATLIFASVTLATVFGFDAVSVKADTFAGGLTPISINYQSQQTDLEDLSKHVARNFPQRVCNAQSTSLLYGITTGLAIVGLDIDVSDVSINKNCEFIAIYRGEDLIKTINPNSDECVSIIGVQLSDQGDDLIEFEPQNNIYMVFSNPGDKDFDEFLKDGTYRIVIPDGVFKIEGKDTKGMEIDYVYSSVNTGVDMTYVLNPVAESSLTSASLFTNTGITISFPSSSFLDYSGKGGGTLTTPSGTVIECLRPTMDVDKGLRYKVSENTEFKENGAYVFKIAPHSVAIDQPAFYDGGDVRANFPGMEAIYYLNDSTVDVAVVGIGAAESYDVYSLDGAAVMLGAGIDSLKGLDAGVYVINGKKVFVKK